MPSSSPTQKDRQLSITSPLGEDVLLLKSVNVTEELGRPFSIQLELLSTTDDISADDILGQSVTVHLVAGGGTRYFNGIVSTFTYMGSTGNYARFSAVLRPWLWLLTRTSDCRVYPISVGAQEMTIPEIIQEVACCAFIPNGMAVKNWVAGFLPAQ